MTEPTKAIVDEIHKIENMKQHRFMNATPEEKKRYLEMVRQKEIGMKKKYNI